MGVSTTVPRLNHYPSANWGATSPTAAGNLFQVKGEGTVNMSEASLWPQNTIYPFPTAAEDIAWAVSDDANDTLAGTGAQVLSVWTLDANKDFIPGAKLPDGAQPNGSVDMNGITAAAVTGPAVGIMRVIFARVEQAGSGGTNAGTITIGIGASAGVGDVLAVIPPGEGATSMAIFTIPSNFSHGEIRQWGASSISGTSDAVYKMFLHFDDVKGTRLQDKFNLAVGVAHEKIFASPLSVQPGTDVELRVEDLVGGGAFTGFGDFELLVVP